jgi:hypothetical protein
MLAPKTPVGSMRQPQPVSAPVAIIGAKTTNQRRSYRTAERRRPSTSAAIAAMTTPATPKRLSVARVRLGGRKA